MPPAGKTVETKTKGDFFESLWTLLGRWPVLVCAIIGVAVGLAYANSLRVPFVFDDLPSILDNPTLQPLGWKALTPPGGTGLTVEGRPVLNLSLALNHAWGGTAVTGYHVVNVGIHLLAALVFFGLVRRTLRAPMFERSVGGHATEIALAAALLWALHPLQTESVTYVVQRTESLMGLFYLVTLYAFARGCAEGDKRGWMAMAVVACVLGMATKEVMVSAPILVLLYDRTFVAGSFREAWQRRKGWYLGLAASWVVLAILLVGTGSRGGTIGASAGVTAWQYACTQARAIVRYLGLTVWPSPLVFDYGSDFVTFGESLPFAVVDVVLLGATGYALWRRPALGFLGAWFFLILAPTTSFVGGTRQMLAEHRMYLSLGAVAVLVAVGLRVWLTRVGWIAWVALAVLLGVMTWERNKDYRDDVTLYADNVAKRPGNAFAHNNLAKALLAAGRTAEAVKEFREALKLSTTPAIAHANLAGALGKLGNFEEAVAEAEAAVKLSPNYADAQFNLGTALMRVGRAAEGIPYLEAAVRLKPGYVEARSNLASALVQAGRGREAVRQYEEAVRLTPGDSESYFGLALAQQRAGDSAAAQKSFEDALRVRPDYAEAHNNLGAILMEKERMREAVAHYREALRLKPDYAEAHANLGNALFQMGQVPAAIQQLEAALRLAPTNTQAHFNLGNAFISTGRAAEAIPHYEAVVRAEPDNADYRTNLGNALFEGGNRAEEAVAQFTVALKLRPNSAETHCNLGVVLASQGRQAEAIRQLEEALRLKPDYAFAREQLAQVRAAGRGR